MRISNFNKDKEKKRQFCRLFLYKKTYNMQITDIKKAKVCVSIIKSKRAKNK